MPIAVHKHRPAPAEPVGVRPRFSLAGEVTDVPRLRLPEGEMPSEVAYQLVHDELMLDGNLRLNLATFVATRGWSPRGASTRPSASTRT